MCVGEFIEMYMFTYSHFNNPNMKSESCYNLHYIIHHTQLYLTISKLKKHYYRARYYSSSLTNGCKLYNKLL